MRDKCFACDRKLGRNPYKVVTADLGQFVFVGSECWKRIGPEGYQPPKGGPVLYRARFDNAGQFVEVLRAEKAA